MVQNVRYLYGHVTLPFEYQTPILCRIPVFGIQMVTVVTWLSELSFHFLSQY